MQGRKAFVMALILLLIPFASMCHAEGQSVKVSIGGETIDLPAPEGFYEISKALTEARHLFEAMTPPNNRLVSVFLSGEDIERLTQGEGAKFERYMLIQVDRNSETATVSEEDFAKLADALKEQHELLLATVKGEAETQLEDFSHTLSTEYSTEVDVELGQTTPLGIFSESDSHISMGNLVSYQIASEGGERDMTMVGGANVLHVSHKVLLVYVYTPYHDDEDIDWVRSTSESWLRQIVAANPSTREGRGSPGGINWPRALLSAIILAMICAVAVVISAFARKHSSRQAATRGR